MVQGSHRPLTPQHRPSACSGTKAQAAVLPQKPGPGHLEVQTSCLREDAAGGSRGDKKMPGLVVRPRELRAQGSVSPQKTKGCEDT